MLDDLQILGAPQLWDQSTATLLDEFRKVHLWLTVPSILLSASSENDSSSLSSWEDVCGLSITMRGAEGHLADWLLRPFNQYNLTLVRAIVLVMCL